MLTIYRRHLTACPHRSKGRTWKNCRCPIWAAGRLGNDYLKRSLDTASWAAAQTAVRTLETELLFPTEKREPITIVSAVEKFLTDCTARELSPATIGKYRVLLEKQLQSFAESKGVRWLEELTIERLREFRQTWKDGALSAYKKGERLRGFFKFCVDTKWLPENPAERMKPPKVQQVRVKIFSPAEWYGILGAIDSYDQRGVYGPANRTRLKAFVLLLRYSGLRIRDAVCLKRSSIQDGKLFLRTAKTGAAVWLPLPPAVLAALDALPGNSEYFFWTGNGLPKSAVADWQRSLRKLFTQANVKGHAHMFRHSFASELLMKGISIETVAEILGNSPAIVKKHYSHFSPAWQARIEEAVRQAWEST